MAKAQELTDRRVVREPGGWVAGRGRPGRRRHGNRPWFKNGSTGLSKVKYFAFSLFKRIVFA